jgi:hypothetical protein
MKPREFDDLVRQKFDQNDFAYSPQNWDRLAEQMDGRSKKRSMLMWLWMPAAGMAASVALALGVTSILRFGAPETGNGGYATTGKFVKHQTEQQVVAMIPYTPHIEETAPQKQIKKAIKTAAPQPTEKIAGNGIGLKLQNILNSTAAVAATNDAAPQKTIAPDLRKDAVVTRRAINTFRQDAPVIKKPINLSVIVSGGVCQGNRNSGYMAGATVRKMINDKVYVEGDVALASSDNTQATLYMDYSGAGGTGGGGNLPGGTAAKPASAGKVTASEKVTSSDDNGFVINNTPTGVAKVHDVSYNLYYAQITPSIGYKIMKRMSIGMGPDFQKMLVDNRPATSEVDRGNIQVAPTFDVGFIGKTEYALTQRVKAGISYRKGINGIITTSNKYIDRDYLQFQMRCTIFNR